jgi:hypothetical protein
MAVTPCVAVGAGGGGDGAEFGGGSFGQQAADRLVQGGVGIEGLGQEHAHGGQRRVDAIDAGAAFGIEGFLDPLGAERIGERQSGCLSELACEGFDLVAECSTVRLNPRRPPCLWGT